MKNTQAGFMGVFMVVLLALLGLMIFLEIEHDRGCEKMGGIIVNAYGTNNCWKNGQFVEVK